MSHGSMGLGNDGKCRSALRPHSSPYLWKPCFTFLYPISKYIDVLQSYPFYAGQHLNGCGNNSGCGLRTGCGALVRAIRPNGGDTMDKSLSHQPVLLPIIGATFGKVSKAA